MPDYDPCDYRNEAQLLQDGTLVITTYETDRTTVQRYPPSHRQYASWLRYAGNPPVGDARPMPTYSGMVSMAEDGVITLFDHGQRADIHPNMLVIQPGDRRYEDARNLVGGLEPGEFKGIAAPPLPQCQAGS